VTRYTALLPTTSEPPSAPGRRDGKPGGLAPQHILAVHRCLHRALAQFDSTASRLVRGDTNGLIDVFVHQQF
jgi:hypothetical protein